MHEGVMKAWLESSHLYGGNVAYVEELYEAYLDDATSVPEEWREVFDQLPKVDGVDVDVKHSEVKAQFAELAKNKHREVVVAAAGTTDAKQVRVLQLINAFRFRGHQNANLDPQTRTLIDNERPDLT